MHSVLLNEPDLDHAIEVLEKEGFIFRRSAGISMFLDGPNAKARDAVHVLFQAKRFVMSIPLPTGRTEIAQGNALGDHSLCRWHIKAIGK